jgi:hypothetical protein
MMLKYSYRLIGIALAVAWVFDFLFWEQEPGLTAVIFLVVLLGGGLYLAYSEGRPPVRSVWVLIGAAGIFGTFLALRQEPMTRVLSTLMILVVLAILVHTFRGGKWLRYGLADYVVGLFQLVVHTLIMPAAINRSTRSTREDERSEGESPGNRRRVFAIFRGVILALPVLFVFAALLGEADPIFQNSLDRFFDLFNLENLGEYIFRGFYILILAVVITSMYGYALLKSGEEELFRKNLPWRGILGMTEAGIVLGSVNLLFLFFVGIQFRYFFGGTTNISIEGFTYAEYARRGFGEMVVVALFSLLLYLGLHSLARRKTTVGQKWFAGLGLLLAVQVGVILASAFQRLLLYESVFGFTRLRTYSHIFMIWIGILLVSFVVLELLKKAQYFGLVMLFAACGFTASLGLSNVDGMIAAQNIARARLGYAFDASYLLVLSTDAVPEMVRQFDNEENPESIREEVGFVLACQSAWLDQAGEVSWRSFHFSRARAAQQLDTIQPAMAAYLVKENVNGGPVVQYLDRTVDCQDFRLD